MPAFIDPDARKVVDLAACYCPDSPHDHDTVTIKAQYGYGDLLELSKVHTNAGRIDPMGERAKLLEIAIAEWSFVDKDRKGIPVGLPMILLLSQEVSEQIVNAVDAAFQQSSPPLPNPSSGRSQPSSRASSTASPNRAQRRATRRSISKSSSSRAGLNGS